MKLNFMLRKFFIFIPRKRKVQFLIVLLLTIFASMLEVATIGAVTPFFLILLDPEKVFNYQIVKYANHFLGLETSKEILFLMVLIFIFVTLLSGVVRLLLNWKTINLAYGIGADLSADIYKLTLYQPYKVHISRNSSEVISGILVKVHGVIASILMPIINMISGLIILMFILATLLFISAQVTIVAAMAFGSIYFLIHKRTKSLKIANGAIISSESSNILKSLQEGIGGIRDILIDRSQETFVESYKKSDSLLRKAQSVNLFLGQSPRYVIESLGIALIILAAFFLSITTEAVSTEATSAIPILGALALGAQRVLPILQQLYFSSSSIQGGRGNLNDILGLLEQSLPSYINEPICMPIAFEKFIKFDSVTFKYDSSKKVAIHNLNLTISKGDRIGIVGRSGSGKSTFGDLLMGLLEPNSGQILIDGVEINNKNYHLWQMNIAHVPQSIFLSDGTFEENIAFGVPLAEIDRNRINYASVKARLAEYIDSLPDKYQTSVGERGLRLSGGQRQRIGIARALYKQANLIILDEATSALDSHTESEVLDAIEDFDQSLTLIVIAHSIRALKGCNRIIEFEDGNIVLDKSYHDYFKKFIGK